MADYDISNVPRRVVYAASGTGPYAFTFEILAAGDIAVYKGDTLLTLTTDYTVSIATNGTGSVTLVASAGTSNITIVGSKTIARTTDFTTGGDFFANTLNDELDAQTIFIQQVAETAERGMKAPVTDPTDINMTLPRKADRAGRYLAFDANGNPLPGPNSTDIDTVVAIASDIQTVSDISANVTTVANNSANVTTVATNISNVNTVGGISSSVSTVAGISSSVTAVAGNATNVNTVGTNISNVNATGSNISNVNAVASNNTNINTVAGQITPTNNVATVAGKATDISTVAGVSSAVSTVAGVSSAVSTVAGIASNVTTVANNNANVTTVATSISNVNTVGGNIANVNQVAADTTVINSASANANSAAASANAAAVSATSASTSAAAASAVALGNEPVRHSVRPSLLLDFANAKQLDPRITFTRPTTATYYDAKTSVKAEENLLQRSQEFDNAIWQPTTQLTVTANTTASPDGSTTADSLFETANTSFHSIIQNYTTTLNSIYTFSAYVKPNGRNYVYLYSNAGGDCSACFDLSTGTFTGYYSAGVVAPSYSITSVGNGWYRVTITTNAETSASSRSFNIGCRDTSGNFSTTYLGDITKGFFVWGAQLEQRSTATAYTATTTAAITNYIPQLLTQQSNEARFDHNPTTGESLGLLIEEQRTNLVTYSGAVGGTNWTLGGASNTATDIAPDGNQTAQKLTEDTSTGMHRVYQQATLAANTTATMSAYVKLASGTRYLYVQYNNGDGIYATYNLSTGTVVGTSSTGTGSVAGSSITSVGNGWYRITLSGIASTTVANPFVQFYISNSATHPPSSAPSYTGDGYSGIYIWGAQLEAGAFATSYIPTVASQVTRSADSASMTLSLIHI